MEPTDCLREIQSLKILCFGVGILAGCLGYALARFVDTWRDS